MALHILFESPYDGHCLEECQRLMRAGDALLLAGDGCYALVGTASDTLAGLRQTGVTVFALDEDCRTRGIELQHQHGVALLDYGGFVDLTLAHASSVSWF